MEALMRTIAGDDVRALVRELKSALPSLGKPTYVRISREGMVVRGMDSQAIIPAATCGAGDRGYQIAYALLLELGLGHEHAGEAPIWDLSDRKEVVITSTFAGPVVRVTDR
jgi:hypothetical protein